jgi:hypothetical protein
MWSMQHYRHCLAMLLCFLVFPCSTGADGPFAVQVVDEATGRGVPMVELKTTSNQVYLTDSNGYAAIGDPTLLGRQVYFHVSSHGYEYRTDGFGFRGTTLDVQPGAEATIQIKRINLAERLYRITGAGIYRDSIQLGKDVPIREPLLNAQVTGQDSVQAVVVGNRIYWFWGDTNRLSYPLGQFNTSGAVSKLPHTGGLRPARGIDLEYFVDEQGFSRPMFPPEPGVLIWVDGAFSVEDPLGKPRVLVHFSRRKSLSEELSSGLAVLNDQSHTFEPLREYTEGDKLYPRGQSFLVHDGGTDYIYFAEPYAIVRVRAQWDAVLDPEQWEAFTPLLAGSNWDAVGPNLDRTADGRLHYAWKKGTVVVNAKRHRQLVADGHIHEDENWLRTVAAKDGTPILLHAGSIKWNPFRKRWILIAHEQGGEASFFGEVWFAEARKPEGPFEKAVRIVTHGNYSFYNVAQHDFFDQDGGRTIFFEGTYTNMFTKDAPATPWYDYNQILYRLDLTDPRLRPAFAK